MSIESQTSADFNQLQNEVTKLHDELKNIFRAFFLNVRTWTDAVENLEFLHFKIVEEHAKCTDRFDSLVAYYNNSLHLRLSSMPEGHALDLEITRQIDLTYEKIRDAHCRYMKAFGGLY